MSALDREGSSRVKGTRDGILLVDKTSGETSFDVVRKVRRASGVKKVGHAGTLDPFSTGLLVILMGQGTKLMPFLLDGRKRYRATIRLGIETDTYDPEGRVVEEKPVPDMEREFVLRALRHFEGEIDQIPPAYSAVRVDGTRAYKLARKGVEVELEQRRVVIHRIELVRMELPDLVVEVHCSSGTYLRSLAFDLGRNLGTGAHLVDLRRTASGSFQVENAVDSHLLAGKRGRDVIRENRIPLVKGLPDLPAVRVGDVMAAKVRNGYQPAWVEILPGRDKGRGNASGERLKLVCSGELVAVVETAGDATGGQERIQISRVFN